MAEPLNLVSGIRLCSPCIDGAGGECHTPGCLLWICRAPDLPLREKIADFGGSIIEESSEAHARAELGKWLAQKPARTFYEWPPDSEFRHWTVRLRDEGSIILRGDGNSWAEAVHAALDKVKP